MVHQRLKDLIFYGMRLYSLAAYPLYRIKFSRSKNLFLHVGSGRRKIPGFVNIDGNPLARWDLLYDVRAKLPFRDNSVKFIFSVNTMEHFYADELLGIFGEFYRVLQEYGILRIVVPDLEICARAYMEKDCNLFPDFPRSFESAGGRFVNYIFCDAQHKITFDFDFMTELLNSVGFQKIHKLSWGNSFMDNGVREKIKPFEEECNHLSLFIEAIK